jgi:acyl dehydratase
VGRLLSRAEPAGCDPHRESVYNYSWIRHFHGRNSPERQAVRPIQGIFFMRSIHAEVGDTVEFAKTVSESDVYMFAGVTGDFSKNHTNDEFMKQSVYGRRIVHGALLIGFTSTASVKMQEQSMAKGIDTTPVSLGYDGIRFLKPVFIGDTITVVYKVASVDHDKLRTVAEIEIVNQHKELVAVAKHITKWVPNVGAS